MDCGYFRHVNPENYGGAFDNPKGGRDILWPAVTLIIADWPFITLKEGTPILKPPVTLRITVWPLTTLSDPL